MNDVMKFLPFKEMMKKVADTGNYRKTSVIVKFTELFQEKIRNFHETIESKTCYVSRNYID